MAAGLLRRGKGHSCWFGDGGDGCAVDGVELRGKLRRNGRGAMMGRVKSPTAPTMGGKECRVEGIKLR